MEHRLILGGEWCLPFARSCIAKLKRSGLPYASQQFEVDGVSVKVRITPGHEYIRLEGGAGILAMDSGVVDLINVGVNSKDRFSAGVLYPTSATGAYASQFTKVADGGRKNPGKSASGQLLGEVTVSEPYPTGKLLDVARSFRPAQRETPEGSGVWVDAKDDANVWAKKFAANSCPPSMFTGKCRLYVQAMYGKPLYGSNTAKTEDADLPMFDGGTRPGLSVLSYDKTATVSLWTSSGLYLDVTSGRHFLINPSGNSVAIYPLVSSKAGEDLRKYITPGTTEYASLGEEDRERAEAHILAYSKPDDKKMVTVGSVGNGAVDTWSMGYGWHWNWSGTIATLTNFGVVVDETYGKAGTVGATIYYESNRYSLAVNISVAENNTFNATARVTPDEVKVKWYVQRGYACIAEPEWGPKALTKSTERYNRSWFDCNAPFYSFYKRDVLQVARVKVKFSQTVPPATRVMSPPGFDQPVGVNGLRYNTFDAEGGSSVTDVPSTYQLDVAFSVGGETATYTALDSVRAEVIHGAKTMGGLSYGFAHLPDGPDYKYTVPYGPQRADGGFAQTVVSDRVFYGCGSAWSIPQTLIYSGVNRIGAIVALVPLYDAESIFLFSHQREFKVETAHITQDLAGQGGYRGGTRYAGGEVLWYGRSSASFATGGTDPVNHPLRNTSTVVERAVLVSNAGSSPARKDLLALALADYGDDSVPIGATVFASAGSDPAVISGLLVNPVNTQRTGELNAFVGWA